MSKDDARRYAPATLRNRDAILAVLRRHLPATGLLLEVAAGTGEHAVHFAAALPGLVFQPTDPHPGARASIAAWAPRGEAEQSAPAAGAGCRGRGLAGGCGRCRALHQHDPHRALGGSPGLLRGAARLLPPGGPLLLYGPYRRGGAHTAPIQRILRCRDSAPRTRTGASATWKRCAEAAAAAASARRRSSRCRPTTSC